jgi:hypothetical protein
MSAIILHEMKAFEYFMRLVDLDYHYYKDIREREI